MSKWIDADEILRYLNRLSNSGLGKQKTLEYLTKETLKNISNKK